jgi:hypothetical protein
MTCPGKNIYAVVASVILLILNADLAAQIDFTYQSEYFYLKGKDASSLPVNWMAPSFDYSLWIKGKAPFRYGDGAGGTELTDMQNNYTTIYLR